MHSRVQAHLVTFSDAEPLEAAQLAAPVRAARAQLGASCSTERGALAGGSESGEQIKEGSTTYSPATFLAGHMQQLPPHRSPKTLL